jgi:hypothetical protein
MTCVSKVERKMLVKHYIVVVVLRLRKVRRNKYSSSSGAFEWRISFMPVWGSLNRGFSFYAFEPSSKPPAEPNLLVSNKVP